MIDPEEVSSSKGEPAPEKVVRNLEKPFDPLPIEDDDESTVVKPFRPKKKANRDIPSKGLKEDTGPKGLKEALREELIRILKTEVPKAVREVTASTGNRAVKTLVKRSGGALKRRRIASKTAQSESHTFSGDIKLASGGSRTETAMKSSKKRKRKSHSGTLESEGNDGWGSKSLEAFWREEAKQPWPAPVPAGHREGSHMLCQAFCDHATYVAFANSVDIKKRENQSEIPSIARAFDPPFHLMNVKRARYDMASELLLWQMAAVMNVDVSRK